MEHLELCHVNYNLKVVCCILQFYDSESCLAVARESRNKSKETARSMCVCNQSILLGSGQLHSACMSVPIYTLTTSTGPLCFSHILCLPASPITHICQVLHVNEKIPNSLSSPERDS